MEPSNWLQNVYWKLELLQLSIHFSGHLLGTSCTADQAEALETIATVEQRPVAEVIRAAITAHVENRRRDPNFQDELRGRIYRAQKLLQR